MSYHIGTKTKCQAFPDDIFNFVSFVEYFYFDSYLLKFVRRGLSDNKPTLFQLMTLRRAYDRPLLDICATKSHWTWWRHQMETFSALLAICAGNSPVPVNSPHKGQWREALMIPLIWAWINDWANNREAGDLRRHRAHYDVIVMSN